MQHGPFLSAFLFQMIRIDQFQDRPYYIYWLILLLAGLPLQLAWAGRDCKGARIVSVASQEQRLLLDVSNLACRILTATCKAVSKQPEAHAHCMSWRLDNLPQIVVS